MTEYDFALNVEVYRNDYGDATNGGVTSRVRTAKLYGSMEAYRKDEYKPKDGSALILRKQHFRDGEYRWCEPIADKPEGHVGYMMGGNFVYSSDSRFRQGINAYPLPVHDRTETPLENRILSR